MSDKTAGVRALEIINEILTDKPVNIIGCGLTRDGDEWVIEVYATAGPMALDQIPDEVDGVRIHVTETGEFELE